MEATHAEPCAGLVDGDGRIAGDLLCIHCGYNLRTLQMGSLCPECGKSVAESVRRHGKDSVEWLGGVADAATNAAAILVIDLVLIALGMTPLSRVADATCVSSVIALLGGGFLFLMFISMTVQDPVLAHREAGVSARRVVRVCLGLLLAGVVAFGVAVASNPFRWGWGTAAAAIVAGGSAVVLPLAMASYLTTLMERISRPDLAKWARWFFGAAAVVGTAAVVGIGLRESKLWRRGPLDVVEPLLILAFLVLIAACVLLICLARALRTAYQQAKKRLEAMEQEDAKALADVLSHAVPDRHES